MEIRSQEAGPLGTTVPPSVTPGIVATLVIETLGLKLHLVLPLSPLRLPCPPENLWTLMLRSKLNVNTAASKDCVTTADQRTT